ncbi:MAG TPA: TlpA disulfide reductase family protein [Thermoanaerobaculia bacterium]|jgi:thiol-disulfide isomerase/thioredoxin|nr:TlpA disulfide reductase family protein [Thermoanaerobaculia bacterium]
MVTGNASEVQPTGDSPVPPVAPAPKAGLDTRWWVAVLVVAAAAALFWPKGDHPKSTAPGGFVVDAMGRPAKLGDRMAPVTLVHFWATWCPPCIEEIPALQKFRRDFADRHDFKVVMIAVADDPAKVRTFLGGGEPDDSLLFDPSWDVAHRYGSTQIPESYLIDRGQVVEKFVGATDWNDAAVRKRIADRL